MNFPITLMPASFLLEGDLATTYFHRQTTEKNKASIPLMSSLQWDLISKPAREARGRERLELGSWPPALGEFPAR